MKKHLFLVLSIIGLLLFISGCGGVDDKNINSEEDIEIQLDDSIYALTSDKTLSKYLSSPKYTKSRISDEESFVYNIEGKLNDTFEKLDKKEQYDFLAHAIIVIREVYKDNGGALKCGEDYICYISEIEFSTSEENYSMDYSEEDGDIINLRLGYKAEYDEDGSLVNDSTSVGGTTTPDSETNNFNPNSEATTNVTGPDTNFSIADGDDWVKMSTYQKKDMITSAINNLQSKGYTISEGTDWFIEALDAFYGEAATNTTKVKEAFALSGVGGGVIIAP
ncbi:hypothetical protein [Neobacillus sp. NPDC093127]|uniref:hypothetical protein n=1 Tax=Neobacillus sp. NPDC093127 TaxID=3364296 RepID=UPI0037F74004